MLHKLKSEQCRTMQCTQCHHQTQNEQDIFLESNEATPRQVIHTSIQEHNNRPKQLGVLHYSVT